MPDPKSFRSMPDEPEEITVSQTDPTEWQSPASNIPMPIADSENTVSQDDQPTQFQ
ncbi:hypothetical protein IQ266_22185, partial [filamentous cyanobacterium LEGE 11480]|nr:hypothetical protein [Romeriopsis navalis LEGE 11480]